MQPVRVSSNRRYLENSDGTPFLWLGDTAWELTHRLTKDEIEHYLETRAAQGFTVIQTVILAELDGLRTPTPEGLLPLDLETLSLETLEPNLGYFTKIDWLLERAAAHGLTIALLPTWGDKVCKWWGVGPEIFHPSNDGESRARAYGKFVGERYQNAQNLVWVIGGDRCSSGHELFPNDSGPEYARVWRELARGIREHDTTHLMTFHPQGARSSSEEELLTDLLDFNMQQSGHHLANGANWIRLKHDLELEPHKPVLDGEPCYEDMPIDMLEHGPRFADREVRIAAYHAIFAGAFGHTYGANSVWQFHAREHSPSQIFAKLTWRESLELLFAAHQLRHFRIFLETFPPSGLTPDWDVVLAPGEERTRILALRSAHQLLVFTPNGSGFKLRETSLETTRWFDTRTGMFQNAVGNTLEFVPPTPEDWVLVVKFTI